jgi:hypothetical protein
MPISKLEGVKILVHGFDIVNSLTFLPKMACKKYALVY